MSKTLSITFFLFLVFCHASVIADPGELDIQWQNKKLTIKARGVTVCKVLEELAAKTNTKIRNNNSCDNLINLNINNKSFDEAIKKILKNDSYVLVDDDTERRLLVYDRNSQQDSNTDMRYDRGSEQVYIPEPQFQPPEQYQDPSSPNMSNTGMVPADPTAGSDMSAPQASMPNPSESPPSPESSQTYGEDSIPITDPNDPYLNPEGTQPATNP